MLTATHQKKQEAGMLTSQQLGGTLGAALAPAALAGAPADGVIRFGDVVMLSAAMGGVLAEDTIARMDLPQEAYSVTRTQQAGAVACTRTAWTVAVPKGSAPPADGVLRVGMRFCLTTTDATGKQVFLQSQRYTLHNQNFSASKGLRKQRAARRRRRARTRRGRSPSSTRPSSRSSRASSAPRPSPPTPLSRSSTPTRASPSARATTLCLTSTAASTR